MRASEIVHPILCAGLVAFVQGCSSSTGTPSTQVSALTGGSAGAGSTVTTALGGTPPTGGSSGQGGAALTGGASNSGTSHSTATSTGGQSATGGAATTGGSKATGGATAGAGGRTGSGGAAASGGATNTGGTMGSGGTSAGGGATALGTGGAATGGSATNGGHSATGGGSALGGSSATGGKPATGGASAIACSASQSVPKSGDQTLTLQSGGRTRSYILHAPSGLSAGVPLALVIDLHGASGNGKQQQGMSGFSSLADTEKFLAVFPDGVDGYWNVDDTCCGTAGKSKIDDVGFLKDIIKKLSVETCIDAKRIYVSGFSNGGGLAHRMGCDAADVIAAIAPTATDLRTQPCNAARPISMMEIKGMNDSLEPYGGGVVGPVGGQYTDVGAKQSQKLWADINQCSGSLTKSDTYCELYTQCASGVETDLCSLPNTDHNTYGNSVGFKVASVVWSMFKRQPMK